MPGAESGQAPACGLQSPLTASALPSSDTRDCRGQPLPPICRRRRSRLASSSTPAFVHGSHRLKTGPRPEVARRKASESAANRPIPLRRLERSVVPHVICARASHRKRVVDAGGHRDEAERGGRSRSVVSRAAPPVPGVLAEERMSRGLQDATEEMVKLGETMSLNNKQTTVGPGPDAAALNR